MPQTNTKRYLNELVVSNEKNEYRIIKHNQELDKNMKH